MIIISIIDEHREWGHPTPASYAYLGHLDSGKMMKKQNKKATKKFEGCVLRASQDKTH